LCKVPDLAPSFGNNDTIQLSDAVFTKLGAGGTRALNPAFSTQFPHACCHSSMA
jgi:hypothetical protein